MYKILDYLENMLTAHNMQSVTSNAVATTLQGYATISALLYKANVKNQQGDVIDGSNVQLVPRGSGLATLNIKDATNTGLSIDFDFSNNIMRVYSITNGTTSGRCDVAMTRAY